MVPTEHKTDKEELRSQDKGPIWGVRHTLALMGILGVTCAYSMRVNLSIGIVAMVGTQNVTNASSVLDVCPVDDSSSVDGDGKAGDFNWNGKTQGLILGAFYWGYAITNVMGGRSAEYFGSRRVFGMAIVLCSVLSCLLPVSASIAPGLFITVRILQGAAQGAVFPSLSFLIASWIHPKHRGTYTTIVFSGLQVGTILTMSLGGVLCDSLGWPSVFYVFGGIGIVWAIPWFLLIHDRPELHPRISEAELRYLQQDKDAYTPQKPLPVPWKKVMSSLQFWAMILASLGNNFGFFTLLTELPTYLSNIQHYDMKSSGFLSALPYLCMLVFSLIWIAFIDYLSNRGKITITNVRKLSNSVAIYGPALALIAMCFVKCQSELAVVIMCFAVGLNGSIFSGYMCSAQDLAPNFAGTLYGISNTVGAITGILAPLLTGIITEHQTLSAWRTVFLISTVIYIATATFYLIVIKDDVQPWNERKIKQESEQKGIDGIQQNIGMEVSNKPLT